MAINTSGQIDGTTVNGALTVTASGRTSTGFTLNFSHLLTMGGYTGAGYETYTAYITISGTGITTKTATMTVKPKATGLSSGQTLTTTSSATFVTSSANATTANISFYIQTSADNSKTTAGTGTVSIPAGTITPTAPSSVIAKGNVGASTSAFYIGYNPDTSITITCSGGSNISKYRYQVSINGGSYSNLTDSTSSSYTYTVSGRSLGDTIRFRVYAISSTNTLSSSCTYSATLTVKYRTPDAPTITSPTTKTLIDVGAALNITWESPVQTVTGYNLEIVIDGVTTSLGTVGSSTLSYTYSAGLAENSEAYLRVAAYNDSATSSYAQSPKFTTIALMPAMVPVYVMVNGSWQPISVNTMVNNE